MLAIELIRISLGIVAYIFGIVGIIGLFVDKDENLPYAFLMFTIIALIVMFHI